MISKKINNPNFKSSNFHLLKYNCDFDEELTNPICIVGMPGIGDVGKFAVDQLIGILNASKFYDIIFYDYPAGAIIDDSVLSTPKAEILVYKDKHNKNDLILVTADAQAMTPRGIYEISDLIAELLFEFGVNKIIALGAHPIKKFDSDNIDIFITQTEEFDVKQFLETGNCKKINKGVIIGSNGLIPTIAKARFNISGTVVLAETQINNNTNENFTDLKASIYLLDFVSRHYNLPIETMFSQDKVMKLSKDLEEKRKKLELELDSYKPETNILEQDKTLYI